MHFLSLNSPALAGKVRNYLFILFKIWRDLRGKLDKSFLYTVKNVINRHDLTKYWKISFYVKNRQVV